MGHDILGGGSNVAGSSDVLLVANNLADVASTSTARTNLGLGNVNQGNWANPSILGSAQRAATDIYMSTYDTSAGTTDHTTAFQNALTAAATILATGVAKVRIILDSRQKYSIGGAVTAGANGQWAQIPLPFSHTVAGTIQLVGIPRGNDYSYIGVGQSGTVIESTLGVAPAFSASVGIASIFGGPASFFNTGGSPAYRGITGFSLIKFATQDITIRSASPVIAGIDAGWLAGFSFDGLLQFDTDQTASIPGGFAFNFAAMTVCTAPQAIPIIFPFSLDWYGTLGDTLVCAGWLGGPFLGEYLHCRRVIVFMTAGAALYVDSSSQISRIEYLTDWNNAYGIATTNPDSATPISPVSAAAKGSLYSGTVATPVEIGTWNIQTSQGGSAPASTQRVYDVMDANDLVYADAKWASVSDGGAYGATAKILGFGASLTGYTLKKRILSKFSVVGQQTPAMPASGVAIRNPYGRDCLAIIKDVSNATVTAVTVNAVAQPLSGIVLVPANGIISVTWTGAGTPTWSWQTT